MQIANVANTDLRMKRIDEKTNCRKTVLNFRDIRLKFANKSVIYKKIKFIRLNKI